MPRRNAGHWSKSLRAAWASRAAEPGARAGRARTGRRARWLRAAPGRARAGRGGTPLLGTRRAAEAEAEGGESLLQASRSRRRVPSRVPALRGGAARLPGARGCLARAAPHAGPQEAAAKGTGLERPLGPQGSGRRRNK